MDTLVRLLIAMFGLVTHLFAYFKTLRVGCIGACMPVSSNGIILFVVLARISIPKTVEVVAPLSGLTLIA